MTVVYLPVRQDPATLALTLGQVLASDGVSEVWATDDNTDPESSALLHRLGVTVLEAPGGDGHYDRTADNRTAERWSADAIGRVAQAKNAAISKFLTTDAERLFILDSDVLIPTGLISHLAETDVAVIAAIYWTVWLDGGRAGPNAFWTSRHDQMRLRTPGHHRVGGTGAAIMIRRDVLEQGIDYTPTAERPWGEDRWFCRRASDAGIPINACTHFDLFHCYRPSDVEAARRWLR